MKNVVTTFLDYQNATLLEQESSIEKLKLDQIIIRNIEGKSLLELSDINFDKLLTYVKSKEVIIVDPLLETFSFKDDENQKVYLEKLDLAASKAKLLKSKNIIYRIPKFDDIGEDKVTILELIKKHILVIKKYKLDVLIMPSDKHKTANYRLIIESLKDKTVKMIYHPVFLYKNKESLVTSLRVLRDFIGMFLVDDCDELYAARLIGTTKNIDLKELFKKFNANGFNGIVALDTSLINLIRRAENYKWIDTTFSRIKKLESKILANFKELNSNDISNFQIIKVQMTVLNLVFSK